MADYGFYSLIISIVSILASIMIGLYQIKIGIRQSRLQQESNALQRATSDKELQRLELLAKDEGKAGRSHLALKLMRDNDAYRFEIKNISTVTAKNIDMKLMLENSKNDPILKREYKSKLPSETLEPGCTIDLKANLTLSSPTSYNALLKWTNPDGSITKEKTFVAL